MFITGVAIILLANILSTVVILRKSKKRNIFKAIITVIITIVNTIILVCYFYELAETQIILGYGTAISILALLLEGILLSIFSKRFSSGEAIFTVFLITWFVLGVLPKAWGSSIWQDDPYEHSIIIKDIEGTDEFYNAPVQITINKDADKAFIEKIEICETYNEGVHKDNCKCTEEKICKFCDLHINEFRYIIHLPKE